MSKGKIGLRPVINPSHQPKPSTQAINPSHQPKPSTQAINPSHQPKSATQVFFRVTPWSKTWMLNPRGIL